MFIPSDSKCDQTFSKRLIPDESMHSSKSDGKGEMLFVFKSEWPTGITCSGVPYRDRHSFTSLSLKPFI